MSLCILLRAPNGRAMMAADTALSAEISSITYRLSDAEDYCKAFEHNGSLIFCSGLYAVCRQIREHIGAMETIDAASIQEYARQAAPSDATSDSDDVVILICRPDGEIVTMRAKDDFAIETQPPVGDGSIAITTIGAHSESAYENAIAMAQETECGLPLITKVFASVLDEEVGAHLLVLERGADGAVQRTHGEFIEPSEIRKIAMSELAHCVIHATDGTFSGTVYAKDGEFSGTLKATTLDGKLVGSKNGGSIEGVSLNIGNGNFTVDPGGNVVIKSGSISWGAVTGTEEIDNKISNAQGTADSAKSSASTAQKIAKQIAAGTYEGGTFIDGTSIYSPDIVGGKITSLGEMRAECDFFVGDKIQLGAFGDAKNTKQILFTGSSNISCRNDYMTISAQFLDFSMCGEIIWGDMAPTAIFG